MKLYVGRAVSRTDDRKLMIWAPSKKEAVDMVGGKLNSRDSSVRVLVDGPIAEHPEIPAGVYVEAIEP